MGDPFHTFITRTYGENLKGDLPLVSHLNLSIKLSKKHAVLLTGIHIKRIVKTTQFAALMPQPLH